jgi:hypothetical protein
MPRALVRCGGPIALLVLVACSSAGSGTSPDAIGPNDWFAQTLEQALAQDASDTQIEVLRRAVETGIVEYEDIEALMEETYACFENNGISVEVLAPIEIIPGMLYPNYTGRFGPDQDPDDMMALVDYCEIHHSLFALSIYGIQPEVQEYRDTELEKILPDALACLRDHGVSVPDDATLNEIRELSWALTVEESVGGEMGVLCIPEDLLDHW